MAGVGAVSNTPRGVSLNPLIKRHSMTSFYAVGEATGATSANPVHHDRRKRLRMQYATDAVERAKASHRV